jgi:hypothetical protein
LADSDGKPLEGRKIPSRRKHLCRNWWNDDWLARTLGVLRLLVGDDGCIRIGGAADEQLVIDSTPLTYEVPVSINDDEAEPPNPDFLPDEDKQDSEGGDIEGDDQ